MEDLFLVVSSFQLKFLIFYNNILFGSAIIAKWFNSRCKFIPGVNVNENGFVLSLINQISRSNRH